MMHRKATPKGQMSNSGMGPAVVNLPPHLKSMFEPRAPLLYRPAIVKRKMPPYHGIGAFVHEFENNAPPERVVQETPLERKNRIKAAKEIEAAKALEETTAAWNPHENEKHTGDAYKTLFVGRLSYEVGESQLRREFEVFGAIKSIRVVHDEEGKHCGYAFVEYEDEEDMKQAFKRGDGKKMEGRRVVVDVERGRTVKDWKPRRLGGGIGDTRKGSEKENKKYSGREAISSFSRRGSERSERGGGSRYGDSRSSYGESRSSKYGDSRSSYGSSRYGDSRGDSRYGDSRGDSRYGNSRSGDSRYGEPRRDDSRRHGRSRSRSRDRRDPGKSRY